MKAKETTSDGAGPNGNFMRRRNTTFSKNIS